MKNFLLPFLFACGAVLMPAADMPSVAGKWMVHSSIAGNDSNWVCTFAQKDDTLSGECASPDTGAKYEATGKITSANGGSTVSWSYMIEYNGSPLTMKYVGGIGTDGSIRGGVTVVEYSVDGDFTASKAA
jgi:hypothetical protein